MLTSYTDLGFFLIILCSFQSAEAWGYFTALNTVLLDAHIFFVCFWQHLFYYTGNITASI